MHDPRTRTLARSLLDQGLTLAEVHRQTGVPTSTLWNWARRPDEPGRVRSQGCPRCHGRELDERAYAYLLGLYLGDGHIAHERKGVFRLSIVCSEAWPGLIEEAARTVTAVMPKNQVGRRGRQGCVEVISRSKHWACLFPQHGQGMKHTRTIAMEPWQQQIIARYTKNFIRGLIHSDGCRSMNRVRRPLKDGDRWYEYPRYTFSNMSRDIQRIFTDALDSLSIAWTQMNNKNISIAKREAVARLDEFVGPKY